MPCGPCREMGAGTGAPGVSSVVAPGQGLPTVDPGGCILETDLGQIDARITSQFKEIEEKIKATMARISGGGKKKRQNDNE